MWRSKKLIVGLVLAVVLLFGSLGGIALADDNADNNHPRTEFMERLAEKLGITVEGLQSKIAEVREELPQINPADWQGRGGPAGHFGNLCEGLSEEEQAAMQEAMADARTRIQAGEDRQEVMAEVFAEFGIDIEEMRADCPEDADGERPFPGFKAPRGMGGMRGFGRPVPAE